MAERIGATVNQQEDFHRRFDLEHVENWDSRHSLQPRILQLAFPHHLVSQHDLARQLGLAVQLEKKTLVHFACEARNRATLTRDEELSGFLTRCCGNCDSDVGGAGTTSGSGDGGKR